jgi:hypothetical protein
MRGRCSQEGGEGVTAQSGSLRSVDALKRAAMLPGRRLVVSSAMYRTAKQKVEHTGSFLAASRRGKEGCLLSPKRARERRDYTKTPAWRMEATAC